MMFKDRRHDLLKIRSRIHRHQKNLSRYCKDVQTTHKANIIRRNLQGKNHSQNIRQKTKNKTKKTSKPIIYKLEFFNLITFIINYMHNAFNLKYTSQNMHGEDINYV